MDAVVARLTLPWMLYDLSRSAEADGTVVTVAPGDERLKPLPAARRRRGLTAIRGSFQEMLSILEFIRDSPTRDELLDYLRASNPKSKDSSLKMIVNILKSEFGVVTHKGERYVLTGRGEAVLESGNAEDLRDWLLTRILGVDHVLLAVRDSGMDVEGIDGLLAKVNPGWKSTFGSRAMQIWLRSLGLLSRDPSGHLELTEVGREWTEYIDWEPECLVLEEEEQAVGPRVVSPVRPVSLETVLKHVATVKPFPDEVVASLHFGLWANERRHFAILTGLSGSGKTLLARAYAAAVVGDGPGSSSRACTLAVQPGWYDPTPLLGYVNPLSRDTYESTPFLTLLLSAVDDPEHPYVVILDEMNLSHPEQYLAPILSGMETGADVHLHSKGDHFDGVPGRVPYPSNLVLIGTVNMDETTLGLSDKVLDRAFTLDFWDVDLADWPGWGRTGLSGADEQQARTVLGELMDVLKPARLHFGWRVVEEVIGFLTQRRGAPDALTSEQALDRAVYAKVLPKLRGEDAPRFRAALTGCEEVLKAHGLTRSRDKIGELRIDLQVMGTARFWR